MGEPLDLALAGVMGPTGRSYWVVEHRFAAGAYPGKAGRGDLEQVPDVIEQALAAGIDLFVNLTQDYPGGTDRHLTHYDSFVEGQAHIDRYPIVDLSIPTVEATVEILDGIDRRLESGSNVYVHCWGGIGRTGTIVGCWLVRHHYATPADVLDVIQELRLGDAGTGLTRVSPETPEQFGFVTDWEPDQ